MPLDNIFRQKKIKWKSGDWLVRTNLTDDNTPIQIGEFVIFKEDYASSGLFKDACGWLLYKKDFKKINIDKRTHINEYF